MNRIASPRLVPGLAALAAAATIAATPAVQSSEWNVDPAHTEINFKVSHFFTPVSGTFQDFDVDLVYDAENVANSSVNVRIDVASVDTKNPDRDEHLKSADFFEAANHPQITFRSRSVRRTGPDQLMASGPLTIKGVTQEIELPIRLLGMQEIPGEMQEMLGGVKRVAGFHAETQIRRQDFGVGVGSWAATMVVGGNVDIEIALEANQL
ncbi:MAG: YceI family protein [Gemmatimonadota bacterium]